MEIKKHYFMTCAALFFLGLIVAKPGTSFYPAPKEHRDCRLVKGKLDCEVKTVEYKINHPPIHYEYQ
jgi:hypothetical protein